MISRETLMRAYDIGCKLAQIQNATGITDALRQMSGSNNPDSLQQKIKSGDEMYGDDQYRGGDTWGHSREITLPSNMGVPSR